MDALQLEYEFEWRSYIEVQIFTEVLGTKAGYLQGLGCSIKPVESSSANLVRSLEEARFEIEIMRARQKDYDELASK